MGTIANAYQSIEVTALTAKYLIDQYYGTDQTAPTGSAARPAAARAWRCRRNFPHSSMGSSPATRLYDHESAALSESNGANAILNV